MQETDIKVIAMELDSCSVPATAKTAESSYRWKHTIEKRLDCYISNADLIKAVDYLGVRQDKFSHSPNTTVYLKPVKA